MGDKHLDKVYDLADAGEMKAFYDGWAATYDAEVAENGYATPRRLAKALAKLAEDKTAPVLDLGCGTGLGALALRAQGFETIDGIDLSPEMLEQARSREGLYRSLTLADLSDPLPVEPATYPLIVAVGVLNPGHAPAETVDLVMEVLPESGLFAFSLNDHARADPSYEGRVSGWVDAGGADLIWKKRGTHLPKIELRSTVYVLRKR